jgi:hypothetical protein
MGVRLDTVGPRGLFWKLKELRMANDTELRIVLDGEAACRGDGWDCHARDKTLFVPYRVAADEVTALLLCGQYGLIMNKLLAMDPARAWCLYLTTVPTPELAN